MHKAVLFDFDGVLGKTMEDNFRAWQLAMRDLGADIAPEEYFPLEGMKVAVLAETLCRMKGIACEAPEDIVRRKEAYYFAHHSFELYPGVRELVARLKEKGVLQAIVTAGRMDRLQKTVDGSFLRLFDAIVTGDKTERGKPFPDPYLMGAREVGYDPVECIVVENAPLGIQSAKAAGAYCIAIASTMGREYLREADEIIEEFKDLRSLSLLRMFLA